jgi:hypothetical protein
MLRTLILFTSLILLSASGCRHRSIDPWHVRGFVGRNIQEFLATGPKPLGIAKGPGEGKTYLFEFSKLDSEVVPDMKPPSLEPPPVKPWVPPFRPGEGASRPRIVPTPVPGEMPTLRPLNRSFLLRVFTDPAGIIQGSSCVELPAPP